MNRPRRRAAGLSVALLGLCACSSSSTPGPAPSLDVPDAGRIDSSVPDGAVTPVPESGSPGPDAQAAGDATSDAARDAIASAGSDAEAGEDAPAFTGPPPAAAACGRTSTWAAGVLLSVSSASDDDVLDSVTPDELSIAWTVGQGNARTLNYADRASTADAFGAPQSLAAGLYVADRASLSPDGLRLVVVNADAQGFSELTRTSRAGGTFGAATAGSYTNLDAAGVLAAGQSYGDPVLGADDAVFYYSVYGGAGQTQTIYRSARLLAGEAWEVGAALQPSASLAAQGTLRRRPTGISADKQTLFFWDEVGADAGGGTERAGWIDETTGVFDAFVDLGARSMAAPNAACSRLYYSAQGASSIDLFTATSQ
jgi:hypothetical protein